MMLLTTVFLTTNALAAISNGMPATNVIGQPDFTTSTSNQYGSATQTDGSKNLSYPYGAAYDKVNELMFVSDDGNGRVLVYDATAVSDGMAAVNVVGDLDFLDLGYEYGATAGQQTTAGVYSLAFDNVNMFLFVADSVGGRVLVYDMSTGISNGMTPYAVLGQNDYVTQGRTSCAGASIYPNSDACSMDPYALAYSETQSTLFVGDMRFGRVLSFTFSGGTITSGMSATGVIGKATLTTAAGGAVSQTNLGQYPQALEVDDVNGVLYVGDQHRVMVYNIADGVQNGEAAINAIGVSTYTQADLGAGATPNPQANNLAGATNGFFGGEDGVASIEIDQASGYLVVLDPAYYRTLMFDLTESRTVMGPTALYVLGQPDFTTITPNTACGGGSAGSVNECGMDLYSSMTLDGEGKMFAVDWLNSRVLVFDFSPTVSGGGGEVVLVNPDPAVIIRAEEQGDGSTDVTLEGFEGVESAIVNLPAGTTPNGGNTEILIETFGNGGGGGIHVQANIPAGTTKSITLTDTSTLVGRFICVIDEATATFSTTSSCGGEKNKAPAAGTSLSFTYPANGGDPAHTVTIATSADGLAVVIDGLLHSVVEFSIDQDGDGVLDADDLCADTDLGGPVPTRSLKAGGMGDDSTIFGCNASQILECKPGANNGEKKWGLSTGTQNVFTNQTGWASSCNL